MTTHLPTLDFYFETIRKKFPKTITLEETEDNVFKREKSFLFKKQWYNDYLFLEYHKGTDDYTISLFKSDWIAFERIELDFLNEAITFTITKQDLETIINCIV